MEGNIQLQAGSDVPANPNEQYPIVTVSTSSVLNSAIFKAFQAPEICKMGSLKQQIKLPFL